MNDRDFVKEAEQNVLNRARDMEMSISLIKAFSRRYSSIMPERYSNEFSEKMHEAQKILYAAFCETITDLFMFTGVGGSEAINYAREKMVERFKDEKDSVKYSIMGLLERNGEASWYRSADEEAFRRQANEKLKNE